MQFHGQRHKRYVQHQDVKLVCISAVDMLYSSLGCKTLRDFEGTKCLHASFEFVTTVTTAVRVQRYIPSKRIWCCVSKAVSLHVFMKTVGVATG